MATGLFVLFFVCSGVFFGMGLIAAYLAWAKGYRPWFWLVSLGPVGALVMLLRPNLNRATTPEEREQWEQRADWTGGVLSGITLFFAMAMPILGMLAFVSPRSVAMVAPAPVVFTVQPDMEEELVPDPQVSPVEPADAAKPNNEPGESSAKENNGQVDLQRNVGELLRDSKPPVTE